MWKLYFSIWFWQKSTSKDLLLGTFWEQLNNVDRHFPSISNKYHHPFTFSVEMHSVFSIFLLFSFSIVPFQAKGKEGNEDDGLKLITDTQDPSFLLWISKATSRHNCPSKLGKFCSRFAFAFTANSLNRIVCGFKPPNRRNKAKTILFFHSYDRKHTVIKPRPNPVSSYIQLSSLAMFSLQSVKMSC